MSILGSSLLALRDEIDLNIDKRQGTFVITAVNEIHWYWLNDRKVHMVASRTIFFSLKLQELLRLRFYHVVSNRAPMLSCHFNTEIVLTFPLASCPVFLC